MRQASKYEYIAKCPRCGKSGDLKPHPEKSGRLILLCECNSGPVIETDEPVPDHQEDEK